MVTRMENIKKEILNYALSVLNERVNLFEMEIYINVNNFDKCRKIVIVLVKMDKDIRAFVSVVNYEKSEITVIDKIENKTSELKTYQIIAGTPSEIFLLKSLLTRRYIYHKDHCLLNDCWPKNYHITIEKPILTLAVKNGWIILKHSKDFFHKNWWKQAAKYYENNAEWMDYYENGDSYLNDEILKKLNYTNEELKKIKKLEKLYFSKIGKKFNRFASVKYYPAPKLLNKPLIKANIDEEMQAAWNMFKQIDSYSDEKVNNSSTLYDRFSNDELIIKQTTKVKNKNDNFFILTTGELNPKYINIDEKDFWKIYPNSIILS